MTQHHTSIPSLADARTYIAQLDLHYIIDAMCDDAYPLPRWTHADATQCAQLYKNFLLLFKLHPKETLVPTREIDEFWHNHILHTKKYHNDCKNIFGYYLHHQPALPSDHPNNLIEGFLRTQALYLAEFKHSLTLINITS